MLPFPILYALLSLGIALSSDASNVTRYAEDTLQNSHGKIIYSSVVFRHGDRTIKAHYPTDPYPAYIWGGLLQLTKRGKQQAYDLGKWYRKRYERMIGGSGYSYNTLLMNSTDTDRALMTGETFLAAMFPPTEDEMWADDGLRWQPIPVHGTPEELDRMAGASANCDRYNREFAYWTSAPQVREFYRKYATAIEYICKNGGFIIPCSEDDVFTAVRLVWTVYNALFVEEAHNLVLPVWTDKIYPEPAKTISEFYFLGKTYSLEMRRLKGGPLLQNMISEMQQKRNGSLERLFHFHSAQETSIVMFLNTLNVWDYRVPDYTASVLLELRKKDSEYYVTVPGCEDPCTLDQFIEVTKYLIPDNWDDECHVGFIETLTFDDYVFIILILALIVAVVAMARYMLVQFVNRRKHRSKVDYDKL